MCGKIVEKIWIIRKINEKYFFEYTVLKNTILNLIRVYQKTLSFDHGFFSYLNNPSFLGCRFYPTCSEYAFRAVEKYGTTKGVFLAIKRIFRCHPFSKGGHDPLK